MAQRQFRIDDTSTWEEKYGNGTDGNLNITSNTTYTNYSTYITATASAGASAIDVATNSHYSNNCLVMIHQDKGTGAGLWELNVVSSISSNTLNLKYPLCNTYTYASNDNNSHNAQVVVMKQYTNATISASQQLTGPFWDQEHTGEISITGGQASGGIMAFFVSNLLDIQGSIIFNGAGGFNTNSDRSGAGRGAGGFRGGTNSKDSSNSGRGEGESSRNYEPQESKDAVDMGGGGGTSGGLNCGAGGGHATAGQDNQGHGSNGGTGGLQGGDNAGLTIMLMGGGGGGARDDTTSTGGGGAGGGIIFLVARNITISGSINCNGGSGGGNNHGGGGGAGGSILLKGQNVTLGSSSVEAVGGAPNSHAGSGAAGRIHVDYSGFVSGTTNPTVDTRLDPVLADPPNAGDYTFFM